MSENFQFDARALIGCICVFASAFFFYLATVIIKWSRIVGLNIDPAFFVFARFVLGFITLLILIKVQKKKIRIQRFHYLMGRTLCNCVAVYCFYKGVDLTSVAQANILNMTYPLFIAVFSWIFLKEQRDFIAVVVVIIAFAGVWLILAPEKIHFQLNSLWALASGISAAVAIMYLNLARQENDTETILFFMFGLGSVIMFVLFFDQFHVTGYLQILYLFFCSLVSIAGQYLLTLGFKYVTAIEGGIISSTRILLAALLGPVIAMDPALSVAGWTGAFLIFTGNVFLTLRRAKR